MKGKIGIFEVSVVLFFYVLPAISIIVDRANGTGMLTAEVIIKWCVFWGVGLRLFTCGLKQSLQPNFTANYVFECYDEKAYPAVRELGFANICTGLCGIISLFYPPFTMAAVLVGALYYLLALIQHLLRKQKNETEIFVTITDLSIVLELLLPTIYIAIFR